MPHDLVHRVRDEVVGEDRYAFTTVCTYPGGGKVVSNRVCEVRDGLVVREVTVEAWDE